MHYTSPIIVLVTIVIMTTIYLLSKIDWLEIEWGQLFINTFILLPLIIAFIPLYLALWLAFAPLLRLASGEWPPLWNFEDWTPVKAEPTPRRRRRRNG